jgi:hypothetical protein
MMLTLVAVVGIAPALAKERDRLDRFEHRFGHNFFDNIFDRFDHRFDETPVLSQESGMNPRAATFRSQEVISTGADSNRCPTPLQVGNTGSNRNTQGFPQYHPTADDLEANGGFFVFTPSLSASCATRRSRSPLRSSSW